MTKIKQTTHIKNVQPHIDSTYDYLNKFLPRTYVKKVKKICDEKGIIASEGVIRNVRTTRTESRLDVLNVLVEVAEEYEAIHKRMEKVS